MTFQNQGYSGISAVSFVGKEVLFLLATFLVPPKPPVQSLRSQISGYVITFCGLLVFVILSLVRLRWKCLPWKSASILLMTPIYPFSTWENLSSPSSTRLPFPWCMTFVQVAGTFAFGRVEELVFLSWGTLMGEALERVIWEISGIGWHVELRVRPTQGASKLSGRHGSEFLAFLSFGWINCNWQVCPLARPYLNSFAVGWLQDGEGPVGMDSASGLAVPHVKQ